MRAESPQWQETVHTMIADKWASTTPLTVQEATRCNIFDRSGRCIIDDPRQPNPAGVPHEFKPVPFQDHRKGGEANMSAFEVVSKDFESTLQLVSFFRSQIAPYRKSLSMEELNEVVHTCLMFPNWLVLRSDNPLRNGDVPREVASLVRIGRGFMKLFIESALEKRALKHMGAKAHTKKPTQESLINDVFDDMLLVDPRTSNPKIVCPSPRSMIERTVGVLFEEVEGNDTILERLGIDLSTQEVRRVKKLGLANKISTVEGQFLYFAQSTIIPPDLLLQLFVRGKVGEVAEFPQEIKRRLEQLVNESLKRLNHAQRLANQALLRDPAPDLTPRDLDSVKVEVKGS